MALEKFYLTWDTDVDAVEGPIPNDSYKRLFYTEEGILKATNKYLFSLVPMDFYLPCPPAPIKLIHAEPPQDLASPGSDSGNLATDGGSCSGESSYLANTADKAIDGNTGTYWRSSILNKPHWWQYDFGGSPQAINYVSISYGSNVGGHGPSDFTILASNTGTFTGEHVILYQATGVTWPDTILKQVFRFTNATAYRFIRIDVTRGFPRVPPVGFDIRIVELEMHVVVAPTTIDLTLLETRGYIYTFVNGYGEEGPPSFVSNLIDTYDGKAVTLTGMSIPSEITPANDDLLGATGLDYSYYNIQYKRIYRINQLAGGSAQYQFVAEIPANDTNYIDNVLDSSLGEVCPSLEWDQAPIGMKGLIALANGVLAGFIQNAVCFSVPYYPHAWVVAWQKPTTRNIVALGAFGTTVCAVTEGQPYLVVGNHPADAVMEKMDVGLSCMSKRGLIHIGNIIVYPSPEGLIGISAAGIDLLMGDAFITNRSEFRQWWLKYNPTTLSGYYWEGKYIGFYMGLDGIGAGFIFDLKTRDMVDLDFYATAGYYDPTEGILYLVIDGKIYMFEQGLLNRYLDYHTKRYKFPYTAFGAIKVVAEGYPFLVDIFYPRVPYTYTTIINSERPQRLPKFLVDTCELRAYSSFEISVFYLASVLGELPI